MDALVPVFIAVLIAQTGGAVQARAARLSERFPDRIPILVGGLVATAGPVLILAGLGGAWMAATMPYDARSLLAGLALLASAAQMLMPLRIPTAEHGNAPLPASLASFAPAMSGDAAPFIVFALAARSGESGLAIAAGMSGVLAATLPAFALGQHWSAARWIRPVRVAGAGLLGVAGALLAVTALQLI